MLHKLILPLVMVGILTGCASTGTQPTAVNQLQIRVAQIESQLDAQDQDIADIKSSFSEIAGQIQRPSYSTSSSTTSTMQEERRVSNTSSSTDNSILRVPVDPQDVQKALKSAGYYSGAIDGKLGSGSQKAIKKFQVEHELASDGIIGARTWEELKNYLN